MHTFDSKEQLDEMANSEDSAEPIRNNYKEQINIDGGGGERVNEREMKERK